MTPTIPAELVALALGRLKAVLSIVQIDDREHALRCALELHNLRHEAYAAGLDDIGDEARRAEVDAVRWRMGDDPTGARVRIAKAARGLLGVFARKAG
jgi:hypothetical protein